jgi:hypothetical protein
MNQGLNAKRIAGLMKRHQDCLISLNEQPTEVIKMKVFDPQRQVFGNHGQMTRDWMGS